jgi:hypothetical protein
MKDKEKDIKGYQRLRAAQYEQLRRQLASRNGGKLGNEVIQVGGGSGAAGSGWTSGWISGWLRLVPAGVGWCRLVPAGASWASCAQALSARAAERRSRACSPDP